MDLYSWGLYAPRTKPTALAGSAQPKPADADPVVSSSSAADGGDAAAKPAAPRKVKVKPMEEPPVSAPRVVDSPPPVAKPPKVRPPLFLPRE